MPKIWILFFFGFALSLLKAQGETLKFPAYQVSVESEAPQGPSFVLNRHQTLIVTLKPLSENSPEVIGFEFDARMPQHKHGMVTQPKIEKMENLKYRVKGVRLHMPGDWVLEFLIKDKKGQTRIEVPWNLPSE